MNFQPPSLHKTRFQAGQPTPFGIYDAGVRPLLARGHQFDSAEQLEKLIEREATVDVREFEDPARKIANARRDQLPAYWDESMGVAKPPVFITVSLLGVVPSSHRDYGAL